MRRVVFGSLVCLAIAVGGSAFAEDATPSSGARMHDSKPVATSKKARATSAPLSAAAAYKATQAGLPAAPLHARTPPVTAEKPWTGVYVGVNAGAAK
ncbi:hypothetical protein [Bradyrhizobium prioriisuperbiae]|uniref:hypothetical protein n=1 Tax=Bradyrhizobium prioriisuperbiae TaxID=2854389 RepID=UPI0028E585A3|nr:hypothetical protein [Bradyrhizobium prioritasuperba]